MAITCPQKKIKEEVANKRREEIQKRIEQEKVESNRKEILRTRDHQVDPNNTENNIGKIGTYSDS